MCWSSMKCDQSYLIYALTFQASRPDAHQNELAIGFMEAVLNGLCVIKRTYKLSSIYTANIFTFLCTYFFLSFLILICGKPAK